ncbi:MAG: hypothetical protein RLZZ591_1940 [Pseudomonadota bacterium]|jgi:muramoyltetrapeptide carboxypeptidase
MAHIYIYSPSGAVRDKAAFRRGVKRLKALGHELEVDVDALSSFQRFAGDDEVRLAALNRAAASGADIALITRGGYGLTRILDRIDYTVLAKAVESGTQFVGMSDFTALQCAMLAKTGAHSWSGPALCEGFGPVDEPDEIMQACFEDLLSGQGEGAGWRQRAHNSASGQQAITTIEDALVWGGNLTILTSLLGTPYFPNIDGGILFVEDVGEHPYRIERMLTQLMLAGVLQRQKALLLGQFTEYKVVPHDKGFKLQTVVDRLRLALSIPVVSNLPCGHVATKVLLPVGVKADLVIEGRDALLFWGHAV